MSFVIWISDTEGSGTVDDPLRPVFNIAQYEAGFPSVYLGDGRFYVGLADVEPAEADRATEIGSARGGAILMMGGEAADRLSPIGAGRAAAVTSWLAARGAVLANPITGATAIGAAFLRIARAINPEITAEWFLEGIGRHPNRRR